MVLAVHFSLFDLVRLNIRAFHYFPSSWSSVAGPLDVPNHPNNKLPAPFSCKLEFSPCFGNLRCNGDNCRWRAPFTSGGVNIAIGRRTGAAFTKAHRPFSNVFGASGTKYNWYRKHSHYSHNSHYKTTEFYNFAARLALFYQFWGKLRFVLFLLGVTIRLSSCLSRFYFLSSFFQESIIGQRFHSLFFHDSRLQKVALLLPLCAAHFYTGWPTHLW